MSHVYRRSTTKLNANLTPMIDVTFLLIVFFVLVSQIVEVESVDLALPELEEPASDFPGEEQRSVISVVPGFEGHALEYRMGSRAFPADDDGIEALTGHLAGLLRVNPSLRVNLRADQHTHYQFVQPVLEAVATAARRIEEFPTTPHLNLVVVREE